MRTRTHRKEQQMTTTQISGGEILRPRTTPITSSILDHATVSPVSDQDFGLRNDQGLWPSYNCVETLTPTPMCPDPTLSESGGFKTFSTAGWQPGFTFAVHGGVQCSAVGLDVEDQRKEIDRVFTANEGKGVEQALLGNRFVASESDQTTDLGLPVSWDDPVDVTPAAAINLPTALALLEGYAATVYAGLPTIHMPRAASTILETSGLIVWDGGKAFTKNGSKVAIGGGYDPESIGTGDWDGTFDLYATGEVYVERSDTLNFQSWTLQRSALGSDESGLSSNTVIALVERMFRVAVDCFVAKATGKVV